MDEIDSLLFELADKLNKDCQKQCDGITDISKCIKCTSNQYFNNIKVDYTCQQKRIIYVLRYLLVHMQEIKQILDGISNDRTFPQDWPNIVNVLSIGGGPAIDIAGFKRFVLNKRQFENSAITFKLIRLEHECGWDDLAKRVHSVIRGDQFKYKNIKKDLLCLPDCVKYRPVQIFLMSYIVSELDDTQCDHIAKAIVELADSRAIVVFNDRNQQNVVDNIERICSRVHIQGEWLRVKIDHCGMSYPVELKNKFDPKLFMKAYRRGVIIANDYKC